MGWAEAFTHLHPFIQWCALWLAWGPICLAFLILKLPFWFYNHHLRHQSVRMHGWPPAHLDADGD